MFVFFYFMSFLFVINMDDWFLVWLGMEINMISFIMLMYERNSLINIESCLKYFFVQSIGSVFFMSLFFLSEIGYEYMGSLILSFKIGGGPFYFWFPTVCSGISWISCLFLMIFQKIIPLMLMMNFISWMMWIIVMSSLMFGALGSFNQVEIKKLLAFSSINHIGWLMMCEIMDNGIWLVYLFMYFLVLFPIIMVFSKNEINMYFNMYKLKQKLMFIIMMMNMGGVPPFLGFFLKWLSFYYISMYSYIIMLVMIFMSIVLLYIYMQICYCFMLGGMMMISWDSKMFKCVESTFLEEFSMLGIVFGSMVLMILMF